MMGQAKSRGSFEQRRNEAITRDATRAVEEKRRNAEMARQRREAEIEERRAVIQAEREGHPIPSTPMLDMRRKVNNSKLMLALAATMSAGILK